MKPNLAKI